MDKCFLPDMGQSGGVEIINVIVIVTIGSHQLAIAHVKPQMGVDEADACLSTIHNRGTTEKRSM